MLTLLSMTREPATSCPYHADAPALKENGQWGAKCRKAYDLDENGQRIPGGKGGWKNHREDTTDWNDKGNVEIWRAAWAAYTNRALEPPVSPPW